MKIATIVASALALSAASASAQEFGSLPSRTVSYSDLDLGSSAGQSALQQRIRAAAAHVCTYESGTQNLQQSLASRVCYKTSLSDGLHQMNRLIAARQTGAAMAAAVTIVGVR
jgi:UrcA family protein